MEKEELIKKAKAKSLFTIRGKLLEAKKVGTIRWCFVLWKLRKGEKVYFNFVTSNAEVIHLLIDAERNTRFKCRFRIESTLFKERWYTNLIAQELTHWRINDDKLKKEEYLQNRQESMFEERKYQKSIINSGGRMHDENIE